MGLRTLKDIKPEFKMERDEFDCGDLFGREQLQKVAREWLKSLQCIPEYYSEYCLKCGEWGDDICEKESHPTYDISETDAISCFIEHFFNLDEGV